ncbi:MAG: rhomboid family intramembrane serine protease [Phycisphaerae bacterium]
MFFFLPYQTNIRPWRTPYANYALIAVNILIFLASYYPVTDPITGRQTVLRDWVYQFMLTPARPYIWQFVTYAFLHGNIGHVLGNMFFLWLFGRNVNDKLGNIGYVSFYLAGAVFSGIGHTLLGGGNVLGASGAVAAVTGAYLALFPQTLIRVFYWLYFFIDTVEFPALYLIVFKLIVWDNIIERSVAHVAYDAHLTGYGFGIIAMLAMLGTGLISSGNYDLWSMIRQWNRRRAYRDAVASGFDPFGRTPSKKIRSKAVKKTKQQKENELILMDLKGEISRRVNERNLPAAAEKYLELVRIDPEQVIDRQNLLDIANQLASNNRHEDAAKAYEKFIKHYSSYEYIEQVELMLGILYSRYLHQTEMAIEHLEIALEKLSDPGQKQMCQSELQRLKNT